MLACLLTAILHAGRPPAARPGAVLLEFHADWCPPCRQMEPIVRQLATQGYPIQRVDVDVDRQAARRYKIAFVPTYILIVGGQEAGRIVGATSYAQLEQLVRRGIGQEQPATSRPHTTLPHPQESAAPSLPADLPVPDKGDLPAPPIPVPEAEPEPPPAEAPPAVVRVLVDLVDGTQAGGSGAILDSDDHGSLVGTAAHVLRGSAQVRVLIDGTPVEAQVVRYDSLWDWAFLTVPVCNLPRFQLAAGDPKTGDPITVAGFGDDGTYRAATGRLVKWVAPGPNEPSQQAELGVKVREGDSGGPAWDQSGNYVGLVSLCDNRTIITCFPRLRRALLDVIEPPQTEEPPDGRESPAEPGGAPLPVPAEPGGAPLPSAPGRPPEEPGGEARRAAGDPRGGAGPLPAAVDLQPAGPQRSPGLQPPAADLTSPEDAPQRTITHHNEPPRPAASPETQTCPTVPVDKTAGPEIGIALLTRAITIAAGAAGIALPTGGAAAAAWLAWWIVRRRIRRRREKQQAGAPADAGVSFPVGRDFDEARQILRLSQAEGREPLCDAIVGRFAQDELQNLAETEPDQPQGRWAQALLATLHERLNQVAPPAAYPDSEEE